LSHDLRRKKKKKVRIPRSSMYCRRLWNDEGEKENRENEKESMSGKS
jgi:hypothetical protein